MINDLKGKLARAFPSDFDHLSLDIAISQSEFAIFEKGIFSGSMDEKWNVFVWNSVLYFVRSWTGYCIYKVAFERFDEQIALKECYVNRNKDEYPSTDIQNDIVILKELIQNYLNRDDLYSDPKLQLPLIKQIIDLGNYHNYKKSIGSNNVGVTKSIYQTLTSSPNTDFFELTGWDNLEKNISGKPDDEPLISLQVQYKEDKSSKTFYFNKDALLLLGEICITKKKGILDFQ